MREERLLYGTVRVLPAALANQIAAGEVVQRPASVVKEAVENAVDAGARRVRVALRGAGLEEIVVGDDGQGMGREDALRSLERHATSKIRVTQDLDNIQTLGFRGEALPSIAAVSRLRLRTCATGQGSGTEIRVEGGTVAAVEEVAAPQGTELRVADLFYNVPARRKFLKNATTEQRNVVAVVTQQALVHFDVGFELRTENRALLTVPPDQSLEERVTEVVGAEAPGGLFWHRAEGDGVTLWFAFAAPHEGRGQRNALRLFVNQRPVQDKLLVRAVLEGYRARAFTAAAQAARLTAASRRWASSCPGSTNSAAASRSRTTASTAPPSNPAGTDATLRLPEPKRSTSNPRAANTSARASAPAHSSALHSNTTGSSSARERGKERS